MISKEIATDIALTYREIETAETLLEQVTSEVGKGGTPDIRDAFGRPVQGLQLGVPSGRDITRLFNVPWTLAKPIIETYIADRKAVLAILSERARIEASGTAPAAE